jgi:uncharacterized protein
MVKPDIFILLKLFPDALPDFYDAGKVQNKGNWRVRDCITMKVEMDAGNNSIYIFKLQVRFKPMTNFIPIFPLNVVLYPGETLNLHIFEARYKELVKECFLAKKPFGVPAVINGSVAEFGTLVNISEIAREYENGEMDIITEGTQVSRILEIIKKIPDKLYSGAIVSYPENSEVYNRKDLIQVVIKAVRELHRMLNITKDFRKPDEELNAYDLAHHAGLSQEEEYELLGLFREEQRQEYLKRHLGRVLPVIVEMEVLKERVQLNGHFKNLSSFRFE